MIAQTFHLSWAAAANWMAQSSPGAKLEQMAFPGEWVRWLHGCIRMLSLLVFAAAAAVCPDFCSAPPQPASVAGGSPSSAERSNITGGWEVPLWCG